MQSCRPSSLYFCQNILENSIIRLHAIVQVNGNHLVGKVMNLFLVGSDFGILCLQGGQLLFSFTRSPVEALEMRCSRSAIAVR